MLDELLVKLLGLMGLQSVVSMTKNNVTRWIVKNKFTRGELNLKEWYKPSFLIDLGLSRVLWIGVIASFTAITFPIGMQISSYKLSNSFPLMRIMTGVVSLVIIPVGFFTAHYGLGEMPLNSQTLVGLAICEASYLISMYGGWLIYQGAKI